VNNEIFVENEEGGMLFKIQHVFESVRPEI
jgi:hypothetical protein